MPAKNEGFNPVPSPENDIDSKHEGMQQSFKAWWERTMNGNEGDDYAQALRASIDVYLATSSLYLLGFGVSPEVARVPLVIAGFEVLRQTIKALCRLDRFTSQ